MATVAAPDRSSIAALAKWAAPCIVSIYLSVEPGLPPGRRDAASRLRRLGKAAERAARAAGGGADLRGQLREITTSDDTFDAIPASARGLAIFADGKECQLIALPTPVAESVQAGPRTNLLPLLPTFTDDSEFYTLAISRHGNKLYRGRRYAFDEIHVPDMPGTIEDALWYVRREPVLNRHGSGMVHASGGGQDLRKTDLAHYLHLVDNAVVAAIGVDGAPLVVAGVAFEVAMYLQATRHRSAIGLTTGGNPQRLLPNTLHRKAIDAVAEKCEPPAAVRRAIELAGSGRLIAGASEAANYAARGAVADVFVNEAVASTFEENERHVAIAAVADTFAFGGDAHLLPSDHMPGGAPIAVLLRY